MMSKSNIVGLKKSVLLHSGKPMFVAETNEPLTIGFAIANMLANKRTNGLEALRLYELTEKILKAGDQISLEESDYALVKSVVEENTTGFTAYTYAQIYRLFALRD